MRAEFVNPFLLSLMNVMSTMAQVELKPGAPRKKNDDVARGDVSGLIGMVGPQTKGSFSITFDKSLALEVMRRMLGEAPTTVNLPPAKPEAYLMTPSKGSSKHPRCYIPIFN